MQVLRHTPAALGGLTLVRFDEHAVHARVHLQYQQGRLGLRARLVVQLQPHGALVWPGFAGRGLHAQAQALSAQGAVGPGEQGGVVVAGLGQASEQFGALRRVLCVEPAGLHAALRGRTRGVQRPARTGQRRGVAARWGAVAGALEPDVGPRWRQVAEGFVARRDPALRVQAVAGGQGVGAGGVHGQASVVSAAGA